MTENDDVKATVGAVFKAGEVFPKNTKIKFKSVEGFQLRALEGSQTGVLGVGC